jgi:hypothetical protein
MSKWNTFNPVSARHSLEKRTLAFSCHGLIDVKTISRGCGPEASEYSERDIVSEARQKPGHAVVLISTPINHDMRTQLLLRV